MDNILLAPIFLPLVAGFLLLFLPNRTKLFAKVLALIISAFVFLRFIRIFNLGPPDYAFSILHIGSFELDFLLSATPLRILMVMAASAFGLLITIYSLKRDTQYAPRNTNIYYGSILLTIGGSAGVLLSNHLLFLLIFWEIVTASLYLLITTGGKNSIFAATKSFAMIGASDAAFLLGVAMVWVLSGTFVISEISVPTTSAVPIIAFLLLATAAVTKAGAMPLHTWLPASGEVAPVTVMALLPAAIDKLLGIYLLLIVVRQLFILNSPALSLVLAIVGAATIVIAAMIAITQHNIKKLLAYSAISQVGYMVLGIATGTVVGLIGAVFHLLNNAIYKCCLFLATGSVEQAAGSADMDKLGGLGKKMPVTFMAFLIAALSLSGIPPLNGFVSKWMVYQGVIEAGATQTGPVAGLWPIWLLAAVFGSALTLAYSVKIIHSVFLSRLPSDLTEVKEVSLSMRLPCLILALLCIFLGVFYTGVLERVIYPALDIEPGTVALSTWDSALATGLIVVGIVVGAVILIVGFLARKVRTVPTWYCGEVQDNDKMIIPGSAFYKTVSNMGGLKQLYHGQEKGYFDLYNHGSRLGLGLTEFLRWLHSGLLSMYLTWVTLGLLLILFIVCRIW